MNVAFKEDGKSTFPEAAHAFVPGNGLVGVQGAVVPPSAVRQSHLSLKTHLHHVCGLCERHCHGTCGAARHEPGHNPGACAARRE